MAQRTSDPDWIGDYELLCDGAGWVPLAGWSYVRLTGRDRSTFLHGMCTNDIKGLGPGRGCEAFVTDVQGRTVGHILTLADDDGIGILAPGGQAAGLLPRWERFIIREDVKLNDLSEAWSWVVLAGARGGDVLRELGVELGSDERLSHRTWCGDGRSLIGCRWESSRPVWLVGWPVSEAVYWRTRLIAAGAVAVAHEAWEALRIELGWPLFGRDITAENLPQEVDRNGLAISFTKGCYLGQETVARIDALGHVNRSLRGLRLGDGLECTEGLSWEHEGKIMAHVTSLTVSPRLHSRLALAYVRRPWAQPGTKLPMPAGQIAEVLSLPIPGEP